MRKKMMIFLLSSILLAGCGEKTEEELVLPKDCGCGGEVEFSIPDDEPLKGTIYFDNGNSIGGTAVGDEQFKYRISFNETSRFGSFYICNNEFIPSELRDKLNSGLAIEEYFYFSGNATKFCDSLFAGISGATLNHIILTKFEKK